MHEMSLMRDLLKKIEAVAEENQATKVTKVKVLVGPLAHMTAEHFKEHYDEVAKGSIAEHAVIEVGEYLQAGPLSQDVILDGIEID